MIVESCCTTLEEALAAQQRGADRIELCADLAVGGVTPPRDLIKEVVDALTIPVNVLIRPAPPETDAGVFLSRKHATLSASRVESPIDKASEMNGFSFSDFVYDASDIVQMIDDIEFCKSVGAAGIVVGALTPEGTIALAAMRRLVAAARPFPVTFHRAFDVCTQDPFVALDQIISLGCSRLLTSGQAPTAWDGRGTLALLVRRAGPRLIILVGRGVNRENLLSLEKETGAMEFHGTRIP